MTKLADNALETILNDLASVLARTPLGDAGDYLEIQVADGRIKATHFNDRGGVTSRADIALRPNDTRARAAR